MQIGRNVLNSLAAAVFCVGVVVAPQQAAALTSVEGTTLGDQGYYWDFAQESWIFPHRIHNIDNRVMLQWGTAFGITANHIGVVNGTAHAGTDPSYNVLANQTADGAGFNVELMENTHLALWISTFGGPDVAGFVERGVAATGWLHSPDDYNPIGTGTVNDLVDIDPACVGGCLAGSPDVDGLSPGRKLDLFLGYLLPAMGLETGLHLFWGSDNRGLERDDSTGPINIDTDSDPVDPSDPLATSDTSNPAKGSFKVTELGIGLGAGYTGMEAMRVDVGLDFSLIGVGWAPNDVKNYVSAGGTGIALNLRGHYEMTDKVTVGGFFRLGRTSLGLEPKKQRDGGDLEPFFDATDDTLPNPPGVPPSGDPAVSTDELTPVQGIKYNETMSDMQLTGLIKYEPTSLATLYGSLGVGRVAASEKTSVRNDWLDETSGSYFATPFIYFGFVGHISRYFDLFMGGGKRWQQFTQSREAYDARIPGDGNAQGGGTPPVGNEDNTNENRRRITEKDTADVSPTYLELGGRLVYGPLQWVCRTDLDILLNGPYLLSGQGHNLSFYTALIYDWDYAEDKDGGNGTLAYSPHQMEAEPAAAPAPAMAPAPAPAPMEQEDRSYDDLGRETTDDEVFDG